MPHVPPLPAGGAGGSDPGAMALGLNSLQSHCAAFSDSPGGEQRLCGHHSSRARVVPRGHQVHVTGSDGGGRGVAGKCLLEETAREKLSEI